MKTFICTCLLFGVALSYEVTENQRDKRGADPGLGLAAYAAYPQFQYPAAPLPFQHLPVPAAPLFAPQLANIHTTITKNVPVPYPVVNTVHVPVDRPVHIEVPVVKHVPVAVDRPVAVEVPRPYPVVVEKRVPVYPVIKRITVVKHKGWWPKW